MKPFKELSRNEKALVVSFLSGLLCLDAVPLSIALHDVNPTVVVVVDNVGFADAYELVDVIENINGNKD